VGRHGFTVAILAGAEAVVGTPADGASTAPVD
jgi:hypothetical protein